MTDLVRLDDVMDVIERLNVPYLLKVHLFDVMTRLHTYPMETMTASCRIDVLMDDEHARKYAEREAARKMVDLLTRDGYVSEKIIDDKYARMAMCNAYEYSLTVIKPSLREDENNG